ncbi:2-oxo acid dehydrogenase subunit E2 [Dehalococcoidia bacterium]|nr:2-oxo acid dehydrogenase subunit E2 [Dehalococcoidia bacterium]
MEHGTVVRWVKHEGDQVTRGEEIAEIETDKAVVPMEAIATGVLRKIIAPEGTMARVGQVIAIIARHDEDISDFEVEATTDVSEADPPDTVPEGTISPTSTNKTITEPTGEQKASPVARRIAREKGVDLSGVTGTGPGGRITREDVLALATTDISSTAKITPSTVAGVQTDTSGRVDLSRMRQTIARSTIQSKGGIPHFYVTSVVDMTNALEARKRLNESLEGTRVSVNDLVIKAAAIALKKFPALNSFYKDDYIETHPYINIGVAIALDEGLVVPAIANCENKSLVEIAHASKDLVQRAHQGMLRQDEYAGGTFSISNLGAFGVDSFSAIILPPQSAVLAIGSVKKQPVVEKGDKLVIRDIMKATISIDHRVSDGVEASRFLAELKKSLEHPEILTP